MHGPTAALFCTVSVVTCSSENPAAKLGWTVSQIEQNQSLNPKNLNHTCGQPLCTSVIFPFLSNIVVLTVQS